MEAFSIPEPPRRGDGARSGCLYDRRRLDGLTFMPVDPRWKYMKHSGAKVLDVLGSRRMAVATLATITGFYYLFVAFTNCVDTDTNRNGVAAVLSMKSTIHTPGTDWRAITDSNVALVAYILIVIWEFLIAFVLLSGAAVWVRVLTGRPRRLRAGLDVAVKLSSLGWTMAMLLFAGGFLTVAGEWFRMWANDDVNASSAALQNFLIAAVGLILVHLPESPASQYSAVPGTSSAQPDSRGTVEVAESARE
ncbi:DUF2165 domain-containing protein [Streptomyces gardneri]|nr:DUF2165 domain-containing protein [Streptomyces gardneri]